MGSYAEVYDFDAFAPSTKRNEEKKQKEKSTVVLIPVEKTKSQIAGESRKVKAKTLRAALVCVAAFVALVMNVYCYQLRDSLDRQITQAQEQYNMMDSQNTELKMQLSNMVSLDRIEKIAVEKLGLVKLNCADIEYVNTNDENRVLVSSGRTME